MRASFRGAPTEERALALARRLLERHHALPRLFASPSSWLQGCGLDVEEANRVRVCGELARRFAEEEMPKTEPLTSPEKAARYLFLKYTRLEQEVAGVVFLDAAWRFIGDLELFRGSATRTHLSPTPILKEAILRGAQGVLLFHTHPSGDPNPSSDDYSFTMRLVKAAEPLDIEVVDHLVLGTYSRWVSIKERRPWGRRVGAMKVSN